MIPSKMHTKNLIACKPTHLLIFTLKKEVDLQAIDLNRLRRYRALEFRQPVTQGKHSTA